MDRCLFPRGSQGCRQMVEGRTQSSQNDHLREQEFGACEERQSHSALLKNLESSSDAEAPFYKKSTFKAWLDSM